jgi:hypothetical protein
MGAFPLNILTFPIWWYSTGLGLIWKWYKKKNHYVLERTGLLLFARHMFEPLYQDYSKSGLIISFFLRIFFLILKSIFFCLNAVFYGLGVLVYIFTLPLIIIMIVFQILQYIKL